jgi:hypothetical protein
MMLMTSPNQAVSLLAFNAARDKGKQAFTGWEPSNDRLLASFDADGLVVRSKGLIEGLDVPVIKIVVQNVDLVASMGRKGAVVQADGSIGLPEQLYQQVEDLGLMALARPRLARLPNPGQTYQMNGFLAT